MFATYFNQHVFTSTLKQASFMQRFGSQEWGYESQTGKLTFGRKTTLQSEVLRNVQHGFRHLALGMGQSVLPDAR
jgi:hypothetical protein